MYFGLWFTPLREAWTNVTARNNSTGKVNWHLQGKHSVVSRKTEHSLYSTDLSSFTMGEAMTRKTRPDSSEYWGCRRDREHARVLNREKERWRR